jgi:leucyl aminopeptidase
MSFELPQPRFLDSAQTCVPIHLIAPGADLPVEAKAFAAASGFEAKAGRSLAFAQEGAPAWVYCVDDSAAADPFQFGALATILPAGAYRLVGAAPRPDLCALSLLLGAYRFTRYKKAKEGARFQAPEGAQAAEVEAQAAAIFLARDLVNIPANDLGPDELEQAARAIAEKFGADVTTWCGGEISQGFPLIHAVGKGSPRAPRLVEIRWNTKAARKLALVGKGVCFDSGGLDIKPESAMGLMKKDMGGAASALAAASMIMAAGLDVNLRLLLPIVENSVSGEAFRPGDIYPSRKGLTVEIGNTDAEGRLILADALALADEEAPDLLVDFATLTGAARVALGPDLPPFFTDDEELAGAISRIGMAQNDPVWRLPLWKAYDSKLDAKISDLTNAPPGGMAGSIMAALFLKRFVTATTAWVHFDIYGWTPAAKPGRPEGGEAQAARLIYQLAREKFGPANLR